MSQQPKLEISKRFSTLRESLNLSQEAFAQKLGISRNYVHLIEAGKKNPGGSLVTLFEQLEAGVQSPKKVSSLGEDKIDYKGRFDITVPGVADLHHLCDSMIAELKDADSGRRKALLESISAVNAELERREASSILSPEAAHVANALIERSESRQQRAQARGPKPRAASSASEPSCEPDRQKKP